MGKMFECKKDHHGNGLNHFKINRDQTQRHQDQPWTKKKGGKTHGAELHRQREDDRARSERVRQHLISGDPL